MLELQILIAIGIKQKGDKCKLDQEAVIVYKPWKALT